MSDLLPYLQVAIYGLTLGGVYALMASGLTLVFGVMRIVNLAHSAFIIVAAYLSYEAFIEFGIDPMLSIAINMPVMFIFGVIIYRVFLARDVENPRYAEITVLLTFALALMTEGVLGYIFTGTNRSITTSYTTSAFLVDPFFISGDDILIIPKAYLYALLMSIALITLVWAFLQFTRMGYAIRATTQNRAA
ncbi:MAG TPA: branched-chain amino acid ABC transporter permease, partial [Aggregatilineales bacterium]|nr:branched-chain amino acid ABC transporter permease [Aggregatilineales bacterium]